MLVGTVIGNITCTVRHESLAGFCLAVVQVQGPAGTPEGDPQIAVDTLFAGVGQQVVLNSDGKFAREIVGHDKSPVRFVVCAIVNEQTSIRPTVATSSASASEGSGARSVDVSKQTSLINDVNVQSPSDAHSKSPPDLLAGREQVSRARKGPGK